MELPEVFKKQFKLETSNLIFIPRKLRSINGNHLQCRVAGKYCEKMISRYKREIKFDD